MKPSKLMCLTSSLLGMALYLAGCGGGGSSTSSADASQSGMTASNFSSVAGVALLAIDGLSNDAVGTAAEVKTMSTGGSVAAPASGSGMIGAVLAILSQTTGNGPATVAGISVSAACPEGGTMSAEGVFQQADRLSTGDNFSVTTSHCGIDGETLSGTVGIVVNSITGVPSNVDSWNADIQVKANNFSEEFSNETVTFNGNMQLKINRTDAENFEIIATGDKLTESHLFKVGATVAGASVQPPQIDVELSNFLLDSKLKGSSVASAAQTLLGNFFMGAVALFKQGIAVTIDPTVAIIRDANRNITQGHLILTDGVARLDVTATGGGNVRLDFYQDKTIAEKEGTATQTVSTTWDNLRSAANILGTKT